MKIANRDARHYVAKQQPFQGSHLYAEYFCVDPTDPSPGQSGYVVYSYGPHHPLLVAIHIDGQDHWFANEDGYSNTTKRHMSQCRPDIYNPSIKLHYLSPSWMHKLVTKGYRSIAAGRVIEGALV
jgi:hypothetical protein